MGVSSYQQFVEHFPKDSIRVSLKVTSSKEKQFVAQMEWTDRQGHLLAKLEGYQAVMDQSLTEAFVKNELATPTLA